MASFFMETALASHRAELTNAVIDWHNSNVRRKAGQSTGM
jgi:hypothetical protein